MIELTTGMFLLFSAFSGTTSTFNDADVIKGNQEMVSTTTTLSQPITVEAYVREYFKDTPILSEIAKCESTFRQFDKNGDPLKGETNKGDIGVMQINKYYHEEDASKLGLDIYTLDGNLAFAKHLYEKYGSDPWVSSSKCWKRYSQVAMK